MKSCSLPHLADDALLRDLRVLVARDRVTTAELLAHLAEADERRLHLPAAYPSMYMYCVHELGMSEDSALKRIQAARAGRRCPEVFAAIADGRLHLTAVGLLAPFLSAENAADLIGAAAHKTKSEVGVLLAERFPRPDVPTLVMAVANEELVQGSGGPGGEPVLADASGTEIQHAPAHVRATTGTEIQHAPAHVGRAAIAPLSAGRFEVRFTLNQSAHDKLAYARSLLGHAVPSGDVAEVFERGLDSLIDRLERRVFAASARTRPVRSVSSRRGSAGGRNAVANCDHATGSTGARRHVSAEVRREVWRRDGGRCTFVSGAGRRCPSCTRLEFDHIEPVARGGDSTVVNLRLRCRAHNQFAAECAFGAGFMDEKRRASRSRATQSIRAATEIEHAPAHVESRAATEIEHVPAHVESRAATEIEHVPAHVESRAATEIEHAPAHVHRGMRRADPDDVVPWLRALGFRASEALQGAAICEGIPDAPLEERVRVALSGLGRGRFMRATSGALPSG